MLNEAQNSWLLIQQKQIPSTDVADALISIFGITALAVENDKVALAALRSMAKIRDLSFVDCYHLELAKEMGEGKIYSFDTQMSRYPDVERIEPN